MKDPRAKTESAQDLQRKPRRTWCKHTRPAAQTAPHMVQIPKTCSANRAAQGATPRQPAPTARHGRPGKISPHTAAKPMTQALHRQPRRTCVSGSEVPAPECPTQSTETPQKTLTRGSWRPYLRELEGFICQAYPPPSGCNMVVTRNMHVPKYSKRASIVGPRGIDISVSCGQRLRARSISCIL